MPELTEIPACSGVQLHNLFDTHAHYADAAFAPDRDTLLGTSLRAAGVAYVMLAGVSLPDCRESQSLAEAYDWIYCSAGIHPEAVDGLPDDWAVQIAGLAKHPKCRAIGEIGLDYHTAGADRALQKEIFLCQLELAAQLDLPVILHIRDAMGDAVELLNRYRPAGVLHCYSGSAETAAELLHIPDLYFSFSGVITYPNARKRIDVLKRIPPERLLLETDCPYLAPVPYRRQRCDSRMLWQTARVMAEARGVPVQELVNQCCENAKRLFRISVPG